MFKITLQSKREFDRNAGPMDYNTGKARGMELPTIDKHRVTLVLSDDTKSANQKEIEEFLPKELPVPMLEAYNSDPKVPAASKLEIDPNKRFVLMGRPVKGKEQDDGSQGWLATYGYRGDRQVDLTEKFAELFGGKEATR